MRINDNKQITIWNVFGFRGQLREVYIYTVTAEYEKGVISWKQNDFEHEEFLSPFFVLWMLWPTLNIPSWNMDDLEIIVSDALAYFN